MAEIEIMGDAFGPGSRASVEPPSGVSPVPASIPIACPFCGCKPRIRVRTPPNDRLSFQVQCGECCCGTSDRYESKAYAVAAWNKRVDPTLPAHVLNRLFSDVWDEAYALGRQAGRRLEQFMRSIDHLRAAQGIVTRQGGDERSEGSVERSEIEPGRPEGDAP